MADLDPSSRLDRETARDAKIVVLNYRAEDNTTVLGMVVRDREVARAIGGKIGAQRIALREISQKEFDDNFAIRYPTEHKKNEDFGIFESAATPTATEAPKDEDADRAALKALAAQELAELPTRSQDRLVSDMLAAAPYLVADFAHDHDIAPIRFDEAKSTLYVAVSTETDELYRAVKAEARVRTVFVPRSIRDIRKDLTLAYKRATDASSSGAENVLEAIISEAIRVHAQDIFIEPVGESDKARVRFAVDGRLRSSSTYGLFDWVTASRVINILRERGKVNPSDNRKPQDGRLDVAMQGRNNALRINVLPTTENRYKSVLRFLNTNITLKGVTDLGMRPDMLQKFERAAKRPNGFIAISGPTGAGKTTTSYAVINEFYDLDHENVYSLEAPVECFINGMTQVNIEADLATAERTGQQTFAEALRALLRQYPHRIFLGEIRDDETLKEAMKASTTGISLIATTHADNAIATISRFETLNANRRELGGSLTAMTSQRLLAKLCPDCKIEDKKPPSDAVVSIAISYGIPRDSARYRPSLAGCKQCQGTSYRDRIGAFEIIELDTTLKSAITNGESVAAITKLAITRGFRPMVVNAIEALYDGLTSEEKILEFLSYDDATNYADEAAQYNRDHRSANKPSISLENDFTGEDGDDDPVLTFKGAK